MSLGNNCRCFRDRNVQLLDLSVTVWLTYIYIYIYVCVFVCVCLGLGRTPQQGAVSSINCAINPSLNSQQAVYYDSNCRPEQATDIARYYTVNALTTFVQLSHSHGHRSNSPFRGLGHDPSRKFVTQITH